MQWRGRKVCSGGSESTSSRVSASIGKNSNHPMRIPWWVLVSSFHCLEDLGDKDPQFVPEGLGTACYG